MSDDDAFENYATELDDALQAQNEEAEVDEVIHGHIRAGLTPRYAAFLTIVGRSGVEGAPATPNQPVRSWRQAVNECLAVGEPYIEDREIMEIIPCEEDLQADGAPSIPVEDMPAILLIMRSAGRKAAEHATPGMPDPETVDSETATPGIAAPEAIIPETSVTKVTGTKKTKPTSNSQILPSRPDLELYVRFASTVNTMEKALIWAVRLARTEKMTTEIIDKHGNVIQRIIAKRRFRNAIGGRPRSFDLIEPLLRRESGATNAELRAALGWRTVPAPSHLIAWCKGANVLSRLEELPRDADNVRRYRLAPPEAGSVAETPF
jgi:hypothetical protein